MEKKLNRPGARLAGWTLLWVAISPAATAADSQTNRFTEPPAVTIDFDRDIRPIFARSCLRCHGPEKPRSHFRLDNRTSALEGGNENTNDIIPGDSGSSLLISYVSRADPDLEMPPAGRGDPLTPRQISRLRAWIDQGAVWSATNEGPQIAVESETTVGGLAVHGNKTKFRELENTGAGAAGGVQNFSLKEQINPNETLTVSGHVLAPEADYKLNLARDHTDLGFIHAGFEQWRKYYDDSGGYSALAVPPEFQSDQDLYVDNGRFWADFGLTPPNRPPVVLGYEYQYQKGTQSMLDWGGANGRNLYPSTEAVDEGTHIIKLDVAQDFHDWQLADSARVEFYHDNKTGAESDILLGGTTPDTFTSTRDSYHDVQGMNTLTVDKQVADWWHLSGGMYYSRLEGGDFFNQTTLIPSISVNNQLSSQSITLRRESEIFSVASLFTPLDYLNFSLGSQNEWTREEGFGGDVPDLDLLVNTPVGSTEDTLKTSQNAGVHFTKIPETVLFSEARLDEENVGEYQYQDASEFIRQTDAFNLHSDVKAGFNLSPWTWLSFSEQYHFQASDTDYNHLTDLFNGLAAAATNGYPAFILNRDTASDGVETKLVLRPTHWLSTTLTCNLTSTEYKSNTDPAFDPGLLAVASPGGVILDGCSHDQTYGVSTTLTPIQRLYFTTAFTFDKTRLDTADNGDLSVGSYQGDIFTLATSATFALNLKTALQAGYLFTRSDYNQNADAPVLPSGLDFTRHQLILGLTRQISDHLSAALHYEFSRYAESGAASLNDFSAQGIFASVSYKWW